MYKPTAEQVFRRLSFIEGEWKGVMSNREQTGLTDDLKCRLDDTRLVCESSLAVNGDNAGTRRFEIWVDGGEVLGTWEFDDERTGTYLCEYEEEKDEFLFNLRDNPTSIDYRTIRRIDMMHFITMEQLPKEGTSSVETLQMEYSRTL